MDDSTRIVIDADGHVLEPADTWLQYLDPHYRDRAIRIARDDQGPEVLLIESVGNTSTLRQRPPHPRVSSP